MNVCMYVCMYLVYVNSRYYLIPNSLQFTLKGYDEIVAVAVTGAMDHMLTTIESAMSARERERLVTSETNISCVCYYFFLQYL